MTQLELPGMPEPQDEPWVAAMDYATVAIATGAHFFTIDDIVKWLTTTLRPVPPPHLRGAAMRRACNHRARVIDQWLPSTTNPARPVRVWKSEIYGKKVFVDG